MIVAPDFFVEPLLPNERGLPSFAVPSAATALRIGGAFTLLQAAIWRCLADAAAKGNLLKSATYRRLSFSQYVFTRAALALLVGTYLFADNMDSPWLGMLVAPPQLVSLWATLQSTPAVLFQGRPQLREAGALESTDEELISEGTDYLQSDVGDFVTGAQWCFSCLLCSSCSRRLLRQARAKRTWLLTRA